MEGLAQVSGKEAGLGPDVLRRHPADKLGPLARTRAYHSLSGHELGLISLRSRRILTLNSVYSNKQAYSNNETPKVILKPRPYSERTHTATFP